MKRTSHFELLNIINKVKINIAYRSYYVWILETQFQI